MYGCGLDAHLTDPGPGYVQTAEDYEREQRQELVYEQLHNAMKSALTAVCAVESLREEFVGLGGSFDRFAVDEAFEFYMAEVGGASEALSKHQLGYE